PVGLVEIELGRAGEIIRGPPTDDRYDQKASGDGHGKLGFFGFENPGLDPGENFFEVAIVGAGLGAAGVEEDVAQRAPVFAVGTEVIPVARTADGAAAVGAEIDEFVNETGEISEVFFLGVFDEVAIGGGIGKVN